MDVRLSKPLVFGEGEAKKTYSKTKTTPATPATDDQPAQPEVTYDVLELDFEALTGGDVDFCAREATTLRGRALDVMVFDLEFQIQIASRASGCPVGALKKLPAIDYVAVAITSQGFFTGSI